MELKEQIIRNFSLYDISQQIILEQAPDLDTKEGIYKYFHISDNCEIQSMSHRYTRIIISGGAFQLIYKMIASDGEIKTYSYGKSRTYKEYHIYDKMVQSNVVLQTSTAEMKLMHLGIKLVVVYQDGEIEKTATKLLYYGSDFIKQITSDQ